MTVSDANGGPVLPSKNDAGLTKRDYFAAAALTAILPVADDAGKRNSDNGVVAKAADYARVAYSVADAMLKAREQ